MTIHATINSAILNELQILNSNRAVFRSRQIDYTTTFFDCLEIRAIREPSGHIVTARELQSWPDYRIAQDEGIMALFASNKKWKKLKFGIDQYCVEIGVVTDLARPRTSSHGSAPSLDPDTMAHLMYAVDLMGSGFGYEETSGHFGGIEELSKSQFVLMISTGDVHALRVKTRYGMLELWVPLMVAAAGVPRRPVRDDSRDYAAAGETIARIFGAALAAWSARR